MIRVTQKGSIITGEQYKKMSCSVELSKGIVSSYLVKFQMIFHMTAKPETIPPHVSRRSLGDSLCGELQFHTATLKSSLRALCLR